MHKILTTIALLFCLVAPAHAADTPAPVSLIGLVSLPEGDHPDIDRFVQAYWKDYYRTAHDHAFGPEHLKVGRFDLNGDGHAELALLIDQQGWGGDLGRPLVIAEWTGDGWAPIGWGWGDEDTLFATSEIISKWRTLDTGTQLLRWDEKFYKATEKAK